MNMGAGVGFLIAMAFAFRKYYRTDKMESSHAAKVEMANEAESTVINTLRQEVERLVKTNAKMSEALQDLQLEVIKLRNENITFIGEVGALRNENARLTAEIIRLQSQLDGWPDKCNNCKWKP
jgi:FtsZ-binding cell division protein ZapB